MLFSGFWFARQRRKWRDVVVTRGRYPPLVSDNGYLKYIYLHAVLIWQVLPSTRSGVHTGKSDLPVLLHPLLRHHWKSQPRKFRGRSCIYQLGLWICRNGHRWKDRTQAGRYSSEDDGRRLSAGKNGSPRASNGLFWIDRSMIWAT